MPAAISRHVTRPPDAGGISPPVQRRRGPYDPDHMARRRRALNCCPLKLNQPLVPAQAETQGPNLLVLH